MADSSGWYYVGEVNGERRAVGPFNDVAFLQLIEQGVTPFGNPWGVPLFGATFFTLTGLHMTHVTAGVIYLGIVAWGFKGGRFDSEDVEVSGLYWHFVDLVWMFIFPLVYLLSNVI